MKLITRFFLPVLACIFLMTSCQKETIDTGGGLTPPDDPQVVETNPLLSRTQGSEDGLDLGCFSIEFPFGLVDSIGTVYTINSIEDLEVIEADGILLVDFAYPLEITFEDGEITSVDNLEELAELFAECLPDGGWENGDFPAYLINLETSCYVLDYPLDLVDDDGETITVNSEEEFADALAEDIYFFVFPITLLDEEQNVVVANDNDEIFEALFACNEIELGDSTVWDWETGFEYLGCYMIEFPLDVVLTDSTVVTVETHEELCDLMLTGELSAYAYPLTLIDEEGAEVVVNSEEELAEALFACWNDNDFFALITFLQGEAEGCFTVNYPITLSSANSEDIVLNSSEDLIDLFDGEVEFDITIEFPVTITFTATGEEVEINDATEALELLDAC